MPPRNSRSGFTLIEVLVFVSVGSVIFFSAIQLIHLSMRISQSAKEQWQSQFALSRLAQDFRQDIQNCTGIEMISNTDWRINLDNGRTVSWNVGDQGLRRTIQLEQPAIEDYLLDDHYLVIFEQAPTARQIRLRVSREIDSLDSTWRLERLVECNLASDVILSTPIESTSADVQDLRP